MHLTKLISFLTIFATVLFVPFNTIGGTPQTNPLIKAIQLFDIGNFTEAEIVLKELLPDNPDNLMVNYYYGACRTENGFYGKKEIDFLLKASVDESPLKTDFYLGTQYHALGNWEQAIKYYNRYKLKTSKEKEESDYVAEKIQQCFNLENPFFVIHDEETEVMVPPELVVEAVQIDSTNEQDSDTIIESKKRINEVEKVEEIIEPEIILQEDTIPLTIKESENTERDTEPSIEAETEINTAPDTLTTHSKEINSVEKGNTIEFIIDDEITYLNTLHFRTPEGLFLFEKGDSIRKELETNIEKQNELRNQYLVAKVKDTKNKIGEQILLLENESYSLKNESSQLFIQSRKNELDYWDQANQQEKEEFISTLNSIVENTEIDTESNNEPIKPIDFVDPSIFYRGNKINNQSEEKVTDELIYKIQIGAFSRAVPPYLQRVYKKLAVIRKIDTYTDEKGVVVYTAGKLTTLDDAIKMQNQIRQEGVEDASVVPYFNGKRITLKQAKDLAGEK